MTILVPSEKMGLEYVSKKYTLPIKVAIAEITGINYDIRFALPEDIKKEEKKPVLQKNPYAPNLNPKYTFDTFVVGSNNKLPMQPPLRLQSRRVKFTILFFCTEAWDWERLI